MVGSKPTCTHSPGQQNTYVFVFYTLYSSINGNRSNVHALYQFIQVLCYAYPCFFAPINRFLNLKISCYLVFTSLSALYIVAGKNWIKAMILTASLFPFLCFSIGLLLNTIAIFYRSLAAIPFGTMVVMFILWAFISFPLVLLGTVVGRNWSGAPNNPCRVKTIPRPIPEKKWYLTPSVISLMGGLLPFGSIFIEMYFVFTSFWNYKVKKKHSGD